MPLTLQDLYDNALQGAMEVVGTGASKVVFEIDDEWVLKVEKDEGNYEELFAVLDEQYEDYDDTVVSDYSSRAFNQTAKEILYYQMLDEGSRDVLAEIDLSRSSVDFGASVMKRYTPLNQVFEGYVSWDRFEPEAAPSFMEEGEELLMRYSEEDGGVRSAIIELLLGAQEYVFDLEIQDTSGIRKVVRRFMNGLHTLYLHAKDNSFFGLDFEDLGARNLGAELDENGEIEKIVIIDYGYMPGEMDFLAEIA